MSRFERFKEMEKIRLEKIYPESFKKQFPGILDDIILLFSLVKNLNHEVISLKLDLMDLIEEDKKNKKAVL